MWWSPRGSDVSPRSVSESSYERPLKLGSWHALGGCKDGEQGTEAPLPFSIVVSFTLGIAPNLVGFSS